MGHHPVEDSNTSSNRTFDSVVSARLSRRQLLKGSASAATIGVIGALGLSACGSSSSDSTPAQPGSGQPTTGTPRSLGFEAVPTSLEDRVRVPAGYRAEVLFAKGDPIEDGISEYLNNGTDVDFDRRSGDEHDGMWFFGISDTGQYDPNRSDRGILCINHENLEDNTLHETGVISAADNSGSRPKVQVDREMNGHGVSCIEVRRNNGEWQVVRSSPYNRRVTIFTEMDVKGPAAGSDLLRSKSSPQGTKRWGTMNNCASGYTPWGTYIAAEENWYAYFTKGDDAASRSADENTLVKRYGVGSAWAYREWDTIDSGSDVYARFDATAAGTDPLSDFRNEPNLHGYVTEIDPFRPAQRPRVRTAFGRFSHEGAWAAPAEAGKPLVFYMGDDSRGEYVYKYVSNANWDPAEASGGLTTGDKYLDDGKLYVAIFNDDGTGEWKELSYGINGLDESNPLFTFRNQGDVMIAARLAADHVGATKMDRPEWAAVHPTTREVYLTLTNGNQSNRPADETDAANPRAINANGHIIRWKEIDNNSAATSFTWDIFLFGSAADRDDDYNVSGLTADNEFSSPDGLFIDHRGLIWIQTDDGALRDTTNNQMLVAIPGSVGDGSRKTITTSGADGTASVDSLVGQDAGSIQLKRFFVGPSGCEITGIYLTPDARTLFVNVQHPGEGGTRELFNMDRSVWPASSRDATAFGEGGNRPRSATVVIYREDGGEIAV
ncbi:PhoX family protein [Marinobacter salicampi]|uniref:PhoX family protein n=1 Tax=Marinobacter salicampi TaxID=435907 RepID=UPI00140C46A2|nr:PhoX family phosphatase [Marinobacter salicampi]